METPSSAWRCLCRLHWAHQARRLQTKAQMSPPTHHPDSPAASAPAGAVAARLTAFLAPAPSRRPATNAARSTEEVPVTHMQPSPGVLHTCTMPDYEYGSTPADRRRIMARELKIALRDIDRLGDSEAWGIIGWNTNEYSVSTAWCPHAAEMTDAIAKILRALAAAPGGPHRCAHRAMEHVRGSGVQRGCSHALQSCPPPRCMPKVDAPSPLAQRWLAALALLQPGMGGRAVQDLWADEGSDARCHARREPPGTRLLHHHRCAVRRPAACPRAHAAHMQHTSRHHAIPGQLCPAHGNTPDPC